VEEDMRLMLAMCLGIGISVSASADPPATNANPALWVVHGSAGTVYMLGSIHALPKNVNWQTPRILDAVAHADTFVFEVPMDEASRASASDAIRKNALLPFSTSLPSYFDDKMREQYRQVIMLTHANAEPIVYMRPWLAALVLQGAASGSSGFIAAEGVDNKIYALASKRKGTKFRALETDEVQFRLLMGDGNMEHELALLGATFTEILNRHGTPIQPLLDAWSKGDAKTLAKLGPDSASLTPQARKALLDDRNRAWAPQIVAMLNEKHTFFITVGAAHLVGKYGVPQLLRASGYNVEGP
jgi:uncharacterized protein YbaP (TraB family)